MKEPVFANVWICISLIVSISVHVHLKFEFTHVYTNSIAWLVRELKMSSISFGQEYDYVSADTD